ncbi:MAG: glycosyltransferase [Alicyclobacillus sp.]|nr:glycosyltransferase [Alicyclobacillus sp.]
MRRSDVGISNLMRWLPHWANTEVYRDYGLPKDIDLLLMGATTGWVYPLRLRMLETLSGRAGFVHHPHPGYQRFSPAEREQVYIGERYAREINRAKIFLTCDSVFHYPLMKYFEVPACNTLLFAPGSREVEDLGFIPGQHFVAIDEHDFLDKIDYYLAHPDERDRIARQGCELVHARHSLAVRARELVHMIEDILRGR